MRSGHGDHFPKKKRELEKRVKNYERILQTVPIILRCTLVSAFKFAYFEKNHASAQQGAKLHYDSINNKQLKTFEHYVRK